MGFRRAGWLLLGALLLAPSVARAQTVEKFDHRWTTLHYVHAHMNVQGKQPECGLYALQSVMGVLNASTGRPVPPVDGPGLGRSVISAAGVGPVGGIAATFSWTQSLLDVARIEGLTDDGWMKTRDVARLAGAYGYPNAYLPDATLDHLRSLLDGGNPVIVAICVAKDGGPTTEGACDGHVVELLGYGTDESGRRYFLAKHGWSNDVRVWDADAFYASWQANGGGGATVVFQPNEPHGGSGSNVARNAQTTAASPISSPPDAPNQGFHH